MTNKELLVIFVKYPEAGKVKTRLSPAIDENNAASLYAAFVSDLAERIRNLSCDRIYFCDPGAPLQRYKEWLAGENTAPQKGETLGARMFEALRSGAEKGYEKTVIIGSDSPHIPLEHIRAAFSLLDECQVALGPDRDGGYYLIGMREPVDLFTGIPWSSGETLKISLEKARSCGVSARLLPGFFDIDTPDDLRRLAHYIQRHPGIRQDLPRTIIELGKIFKGNPILNECCSHHTGL